MACIFTGKYKVKLYVFTVIFQESTNCVVVSQRDVFVHFFPFSVSNTIHEVFYTTII